MTDPGKTKDQLIEELATLRQRVVELEAADVGRERTEIALQHSEDRHRAILDHTSHFIGLLEPDGTLLDANKAALQFGNLDRADVVGKPFWDCPWWTHSPAQQTQLRDGVREAAGGAFVRYEASHATPDGDIRIVDGSLKPVTDETGKVVFIIPEGRDITERKRADEERQDLEAQVQQTQKLESLGILAGGIAHDFNNLLVGILGNAELALHNLPANSPVCDNLESLVATARRAKALTNQMLAYSGKGQFVLEDIDLRRLVNDMSGLLQSSVTKKASLELKLPEGLNAIRADASQIRQIVMNLIINASEAIGDEPGRITVTAHGDRCDRSCPCRAGIAGGSEWPEVPRVVLEVADTGCGMDERTRKRIFEPFFTTKFTGRGLGMAAVQGIIRGHQAGIEVVSEPTKGTTIRVYFRALDHPAAPEKRPEQPSESWHSSGTILLVDDEPMVRRVATQMLELVGFSVLTAPDGAAGIELLRQRHDEIACVLLDLEMPRMNGVQTCDEMRRAKVDVPVILSSGYSEQESTKRFGTQCLAGFLQKPYELTTLQAKLREVLGERE